MDWYRDSLGERCERIYFFCDQISSRQIVGPRPSRSDGVLLLDTTMEPAKPLGSKTEAKAWLDGVVAAYPQRSGGSGISWLPRGVSGGTAAGAGATEFLKFPQEQEQFVAQRVEPRMLASGFYEFANTKATSNAETEFAMDHGHPDRLQQLEQE
jgi:hypothetical protein